jgi:hypothetical protein
MAEDERQGCTSRVSRKETHRSASCCGSAKGSKLFGFGFGFGFVSGSVAAECRFRSPVTAETT